MSNLTKIIKLLTDKRGELFASTDQGIEELAGYLAINGYIVKDYVPKTVWVFYFEHKGIDRKGNPIKRHLKVQTDSFLKHALCYEGIDCIKIVEKPTAKQDMDRLGRLAFKSEKDAKSYLSHIMFKLSQKGVQSKQ